MKIKTNHIQEYLRDYIKCIYGNKFTLAGYSLLAGGLTSLKLGQLVQSNSLEEFITSIGAISIGAGITSLLTSGLGIVTFYDYKRTKECLNKKDRLKIKQIADGAFYCNSVGIKLAIREHNQEMRENLWKN